MRKPEESKVVKLIVFIFVMFITSLIVPTITKAGSIHHVSGPLADASFFSLDPPGCNAVCPSPTSCIETDVFLSISDQKVQTPPGSAGKSVPQVNFLSIFQFDVCTGETLFDTSQCSPPTAINLQIAKKLDSATLNTTLEFLSSCLVLTSTCPQT
jgi:hypothetical protein